MIPRRNALSKEKFKKVKIFSWGISVSPQVKIEF
jgi:hypothetical protein